MRSDLVVVPLDTVRRQTSDVGEQLRLAAELGRGLPVIVTSSSGLLWVDAVEARR